MKYIKLFENFINTPKYYNWRDDVLSLVSIENNDYYQDITDQWEEGPDPQNVYSDFLKKSFQEQKSKEETASGLIKILLDK